MKVAFAENNVLGASGLEETKGFQIRASAHAFKILSSGLYSDKVRAVLREIGCNAADAHIAAGCPDRQFRVKLPNPLDDQFYVQDWGPGLSHEEVMSLYTTYFASTKQSSNDFTGAFGLGSKSPFSYTDSFSVTSTHGGRKRTYSLYIGNEGAPQVSLMSEEDPDQEWPTGIRVGFAVRPEHFNEFVDKAQEVYQWFKTPPEMRGCPPIKPVQYVSDREDFRILRDAGDPVLLMGNVAYPLDLSQCKLEPIHKGAAAAKVINYATSVRGLVLPLPIGSVQVAASREALQYDPQSIKVIRERLELAMRRLGADVVDALHTALSGGWRDLCKVQDMVEATLPGALKYNFDEFGKALGLPDATIAKLKPFVHRDDVKIPALAGTVAACKLVKVRKYGRGRGRPHASWVSQGVSQQGNPAKLEVLQGTVIAAGACAQALPRAKKAVGEQKYEQILVFSKNDKHKATAQEIWDEARAVAKELGDVEVIDLATLEAPPVKPGGKRRRPKGWQPSLPTGVEFPVYVVSGKDKSMELGSAPSQLFMCKTTRSRWGNVSHHARAYAGEDTDPILDWDKWNNLWFCYCNIQRAVDLKDSPMSYAVLTAKEARGLQIVKLGWTDALSAIKRYVERPELRQVLRKRLGRKHIVAPKTVYDVGSGWMSGLSYLLGEGKLGADTVERLRHLNVLKILEEMVAARSRTAKVIPDEITAYQRLVEWFRIDNALAGDIRDALTVEDADGAFHGRFARCDLIDVRQVVKLGPSDIDATVQFVLAKEA